MDDNEDFDFDALEHERLISAIKKLDKTQHITAPTRNEPTNLNSEFNLIKRSKKLDIFNAAKLLEDTAHHVKISKKLKATQNASQVLPKPLEKPQLERIKRETGYVETKEKIGRWDPIVARSRTVDFVSFPLKPLETKNNIAPTKTFLSKLKLKSPLEKELEEVDPPGEVVDEETDDERFPMTYEEMLEHRQHLAKLRAKQSYKAAKAKRQSKIKSKKYHRILKKEKLKQQLKEFEELQVKNPEEALKKLQELEKIRALERHTLRHKNTGKWAKNKLVRAKYDKEVRQQLAEQLSVSRSMTHKIINAESSGDESDKNIDMDLAISQDPLNPWMLKMADKSNIDEEFNFGYKKYIKDKMYKRKELSDSDSEDDVPDNQHEKQIANIALKCPENSDDKVRDMHTEIEVAAAVDELKKITIDKKSSNLRKKQKTSTPIATTNWSVENMPEEVCNINNLKDISEKFESFECKVVKRVEKKLNKLRNDINKLEKKSRTSAHITSRKQECFRDNLEYLQFKNQKPKPIIDEALIETNKESSEQPLNENIIREIELQTVPVGVEKDKKNTNIDPSNFIKVKPKFLNSAVSKGTNDVDLLDDDDDDEQVVPKVDIEEVFEDDDVVASFRQEKDDEINKDKPEEINLGLPGWGTWGGKGVKAPKRKRTRFIGKPIPKSQRRDDNKGDIIIMETKDPKLSVHKVTEVPFPFNSVKDYEASIRAPLGNTFIPERAHKKLIRPNVITKSGTVIEPMDEEELLKPRKSFRNEAIIKLSAKK